MLRSRVGGSCAHVQILLVWWAVCGEAARSETQGPSTAAEKSSTGGVGGKPPYRWDLGSATPPEGS